MGTLGILYFVCGIIYIIACVMDGQDVKPLWKKWVGRNLEKAANYFFPIKYVTETNDAVKVASQTMITESDLMMAFRHMPYTKSDFANILINENKSECFNAIFRKIAAENVVNFEVDRETQRPNIIVRAWMYVGRKRN